MSRLHKNKQYYARTEWTVRKVRQEINEGLKLLNKIEEPIVTFFGSRNVKPEGVYYEHCRQLAYELGKRGHAIMTGGGPGIMEAANSGATESGARSIGFRAALLRSEKTRRVLYTDVCSFHFLFVRRFIMSIKSEALVFYPGGYGTLNELFEYAMLMQTNIVDTVPIICVHKGYWRGLFSWMRNHPMKENLLVHGQKDLHLLRLLDDQREIIEAIEAGSVKGSGKKF